MNSKGNLIIIKLL